jgi:exodeoxyribonuclease VII large subunit
MHTRLATSAAERAILETAERASRNVALVAERSSALFREIAGQGPQKTLRRGFAVVRSPSGKTITTADALSADADIEIDLHDGMITATVGAVKNSPETHGESHK